MNRLIIMEALIDAIYVDATIKLDGSRICKSSDRHDSLIDTLSKSLLSMHARDAKNAGGGGATIQQRWFYGSKVIRF